MVDANKILAFISKQVPKKNNLRLEVFNND